MAEKFQARLAAVLPTLRALAQSDHIDVSSPDR